MIVCCLRMCLHCRLRALTLCLPYRVALMLACPAAAACVHCCFACPCVPCRFACPAACLHCCFACPAACLPCPAGLSCHIPALLLTTCLPRSLPIPYRLPALYCCAFSSSTTSLHYVSQMILFVFVCVCMHSRFRFTIASLRMPPLPRREVSPLATIRL